MPYFDDGTLPLSVHPFHEPFLSSATRLPARGVPDPSSTCAHTSPVPDERPRPFGAMAVDFVRCVRRLRSVIRTQWSAVSGVHWVRPRLPTGPTEFETLRDSGHAWDAGRLCACVLRPPEPRLAASWCSRTLSPPEPRRARTGADGSLASSHRNHLPRAHQRFRPGTSVRLCVHEGGGARAGSELQCANGSW